MKITSQAGFILGTLLLAAVASGQQQYFLQNRFEISGLYGLYSPSEKIKDAYRESSIDPYGNTIFYDDEGTYGGFGMSFRLLFRMKQSPIKLGVELGGFTMREEKVSLYPLIYKDTGEAVEETRYLNGNHLQLMSDVYLFSLDKIIVHSQFGTGFLLYWDTDLGFGKAPFRPTRELMASAKIIASIPIQKLYSIDVQYGLIKGFSDNNVYTPQFHVGISAAWGQSPDNSKPQD